MSGVNPMDLRRRAEQHRPSTPEEVRVAIRDLKTRLGMGDHDIGFLLDLSVDQVRRSLAERLDG